MSISEIRQGNVIVFLKIDMSHQDPPPPVNNHYEGSVVEFSCRAHRLQSLGLSSPLPQAFGHLRHHVVGARDGVQPAPSYRPRVGRVVRSVFVLIRLDGDRMGLGKSNKV